MATPTRFSVSFLTGGKLLIMFVVEAIQKLYAGRYGVLVSRVVRRFLNL